MSTMTQSLRLLVLLLSDLVRQTPLPARLYLIAAVFVSFFGAGSPAPRPARFARALSARTLFVRCLLANSSLRRWYLHIRYLVGLTTACLPLSASGFLCGGGEGVLSRLPVNLARWSLRARASTYRVARKYQDVAEHIIRLYHARFAILVLLFLPFLSRRFRQALFGGRQVELFVGERVGGGLCYEIGITGRRS